MSETATSPAIEGESPPAQQTDAAPRIVLVLRELGPGGVLALGGVALAALAFLAFVVQRALEPSYEIVFAGLALDEARAIAQELQAAGQDFRLSDDGSAILAPRDQALAMRMSLAEAGLPSGGAVGYEIFDRSSALGSTDFLSDVNLKRALEGELARTISSLRAVRSARVHIVQPRRRLFERESAPPSAAIALSLRPGARLTSSEIAGVRNLAAAATPGLSPSGVTIVDGAGALLARGADDEAALAARDEERRAAYESRLRNKIVQLLERSVGMGRVEAEVTVDMDFDQVTTTTEDFDPNAQVARSTQTIEDNRELQEREDDRAVTVEQNLPTDAVEDAVGPSSSESRLRTEEIVNFEISKTVTNHVRRGGEVTRLSIAVQVDGIYEEAEGGERVYRERDEEELAQLAALVRGAVGFDAARGDVVEVVSRRFAPLPLELPEEAGLLAFSKNDLLRLAELATLALCAGLVLLFVIRPIFARLFRDLEPVKPVETAVLSGPKGQPLLVHGATGAAISVDEEGSPVVVRQPAETLIGGPTPASVEISDDGELMDDDEEMVTLRQIQGQVRASLVRDVADVITESPETAIRIIRNWMHDE